MLTISAPGVSYVGWPYPLPESSESLNVKSLPPSTMIPVERAQESRETLLKRGLNVQYREFEMQHEINPEALRELVVWLEEKVFNLIQLA